MRTKNRFIVGPCLGLTMNDEYGDPLQAGHEKPFHLNPDVLKITMPFRMQIRYVPDRKLADTSRVFPSSGSSGAGKTTAILEMIRFRELMFSHRFERIIYCYPFEDVSPHSKEIRAEYKKLYSTLEVRHICQGRRLHRIGNFDKITGKQRTARCKKTGLVGKNTAHLTYN